MEHLDDAFISRLMTIRKLATVQLFIAPFCLFNGALAVGLSEGRLVHVSGAVEVWAPAFFVVAGISGVLTRTRPRVIAHMVLCTVDAAMTAGLIGGSAFALASDWPGKQFLGRVVSIPHILLTFFGFIVLIMSVVSAFKCYKIVWRKPATKVGEVASKPSSATTTIGCDVNSPTYAALPQDAAKESRSASTPPPPTYAYVIGWRG